MKAEDIIIPSPYNDWEAFRKLGDRLDPDDALTCRFRKAMGLPDDNLTEESERLLTFEEVRKTVTVAFAQAMSGRAATDVYTETGLNFTLTSRFLRSAADMVPFEKKPSNSGLGRWPSVANPESGRPFSAPLGVIPAVADNVMHCSVHRMFFGEEGQVVLPRIYCKAAEAAMKLSPVEKNRFIDHGLALVSRNIEEHGIDFEDRDLTMHAEYGQFRRPAEILCERINELSYENPYMTGARYILNKKTGGPRNLKTSLGILASRENAKAPEKAETDPKTGKIIRQAVYEPGLELVMFLALESGQAMDYFIRNDYINISGGASFKGHRRPYVKILADLGNGIEEIRDEDVLRILSFCISLSRDRKDTYLGYLIGTGLKL